MKSPDPTKRKEDVRKTTGHFSETQSKEQNGEAERTEEAR